MKKSLIIATSILGLSLLLCSCNTLSGIEKEKTDDGFIQSTDLVYKTVKIEHPSLVPNFDVGKFNVYGNKQFENIQAYILDDKFYLEADYGNKSRKTLKIDTVMFFTTRNKIAFSNVEKDLPNTYYNFKDIDGLSYENLKVILSPEDMNLLGRFLIADDVYIAFAGERGRTDLFKLTKKVKRSMLAVINKLNKINNQPVIEEPKPEPKAKPVDETTSEENAESEEATEEKTAAADETVETSTETGPIAATESTNKE